MLYIWKPDGGAPPPGAGGKAAGLAGLQAAGLPVPPWFVVLPAAYRASADAAAGPGAQTATAPFALADAVAAELSEALRSLSPGLVAVRSSAVDEDGAAHSFAGQLESFLKVPQAEVPARVAAVWQSAFAERNLAYRRERGITDPPHPPGVVVQVMVAADAAGVCFTSDPVSGRRGVSVVAAVSGLGERLVGGEADADTWWIDRSGQVVATQPTTQPVLTDAEAAQVAALARAAAAAYGRPQDVEWARAGGAFSLLQSRPITTLSATPDPDAPLVIWDNSNISESYGGVTTPLTFSFALGVYEAVYTQFLRLLLVRPEAIEAHRPALQQMLGLVDGRLYYNLLNWYRLLALMPGFKWNRGFMEQMMGVAEGLPPDVVADLEGAKGGRLADLLHLLRALAGLGRAWASLPGRIRRFTRRLDAALEPPPVPLTSMRADELIAYYRRLEQHLLWSWDAPLINDFAAMVSFGLLRKWSVAWCGDTDGTLQNGLLSGQGGMVSAEPAALIAQMGALAAADPALLERLHHPSAALARELAQSETPFGRILRGYLAKFGERCLEELKLESPTLHDDPAPLLAAVRAVAGRGAPPGPISGLGAVAEVKAPHLPLLRQWLFNWALRQTRQTLRDRENLRLERTRVFGRVRAIARELGARLFAVGRLDHPADVFYLELGELFSAFNATATTADLRALVALRRREWEQYPLAEAPPSRIAERDGVRLVADRPAGVGHAGEAMQGIGCCPGRVEGRVRVIRDPRHAVIEPGEILVAERTDPGWVMLFPVAAGVLVERGSLLSHAAIVSRELGVPSVVGLTGLTAWLADGDTVVFDGRTGLVQRLRGGGGHDEAGQ
jgi:rifampicin phosphotransferase